MDRRIAVGFVAGLLVAGGVLTAQTVGRVETAGRRLLSDCDGKVAVAVIHHVPAAAPLTAAAYRDTLSAFDADTTVLVVVERAEDFADLVGRVGPVACRLTPVVTGHPVTTWSRDRWLALRPASGDGPTTLLAPREEVGADRWPARAGDARVHADLAAAWPSALDAERSPLPFDGGDFVADGRTVFVSPQVLMRATGRGLQGEDALVAHLAETLGLRVVLLTGAPVHHAGMVLATAPGGVVVVGDPSLARGLLDTRTAAPEGLTGVGDDWSADTQARFDAAARHAAAAGHRVVRIPVVPGHDGRTFLTWTNVVLDGDRVLMPVYGRPSALDAAAEAVWRDLGLTVVRVDAADVFAHFGSLRCLVHVAARRPADAT